MLSRFLFYSWIFLSASSYFPSPHNFSLSLSFFSSLAPAPEVITDTAVLFRRDISERALHLLLATVSSCRLLLPLSFLACLLLCFGKHHRSPLSFRFVVPFRLSCFLSIASLFLTERGVACLAIRLPLQRSLASFGFILYSPSVLPNLKVDTLACTCSISLRFVNSL